MTTAACCTELESLDRRQCLCHPRVRELFHSEYPGLLSLISSSLEAQCDFPILSPCMRGGDARQETRSPQENTVGVVDGEPPATLDAILKDSTDMLSEPSQLGWVQRGVLPPWSIGNSGYPRPQGTALPSATCDGAELLAFEVLDCPAVFRPSTAGHPPATVAACCSEVRTMDASGV
jgi:hypothetical protein